MSATAARNLASRRDSDVSGPAQRRSTRIGSRSSASISAGGSESVASGSNRLRSRSHAQLPDTTTMTRFSVPCNSSRRAHLLLDPFASCGMWRCHEQEVAGLAHRLMQPAGKVTAGAKTGLVAEHPKCRSAHRERLGEASEPPLERYRDLRVLARVGKEDVIANASRTDDRRRLRARSRCHQREAYTVWRGPAAPVSSAIDRKVAAPIRPQTRGVGEKQHPSARCRP